MIVQILVCVSQGKESMGNDRQLLAKERIMVKKGPWGWMEECGEFTNLQVLGLVENGWSESSVINCKN